LDVAFLTAVLDPLSIIVFLLALSSFIVNSIC
jgi:energy-converting hydrogenase Eha subunit C